MATQNPYSNSLLMDAFRGSLSNAESLGRGFAVAPIGLLGDINALARQYVTPRLPQGVQSLLQSAPAAPTTEQILSNIPRVSNPRMETAGMEQLGAAMNFKGPVDVAKGAGRLAGNAINEAMVYGRGPLASITPQPMRVLPPKQFRGATLEGMPSKVDVGGRIEEFGTDQRLVDIAKDLTEKRGLLYSPQLKYAGVDPERAKRIANQYEVMQNNPSDPKVKKAYDAMINETMDQYEALRKAGYKFNFMPESGDIYGNPRNAINDIVMNQRLSVFPTEQGFGSLVEASQANPLLMKTGEKWSGKDVTVNDIFRATHDVFGHGKHGVGFRAVGEENALQSHARMYSPEALPAVVSETRGQNSWVNYGPYGAQNRVASPENTIYAEQKTGIMQPWTWQEGLLNMK
jgi:hypothetical protein